MPETFTADDFSAAAAPASPTPAAFAADAFSSGADDDGIFRPEDFAPGAKSAVPGSREARRIELKLELQRVRSEPEPKVFGVSPRGPLGSIVEGANKGAGAIARGLGHLMEIMPPGGPDVVQSMPYAPRGPEDLSGQQYQEKVSDPLKLKEAIERNPLTQAGKAMEETGEAFAPEDFERDSVVNQALSGAAELAPVMNPAAPVVIGLQGLGRDIQNDFDELKQKGLSDQDAADGAIHRAEAAGFSQFAVWTVLPEPLRKLGEKYLIERVGEDAGKRFLAGRIATAGEGAVLGGTSKAAENFTTGQPIGQDVGKSGLGMATLNLGLPRLNRAGQEIPSRTEPGSGAEPTAPPPNRTQPPAPVSPVPVTRDLAADLQAAMRGNQVSGQPATAAAPAPAEAIKDNLVGEAVRQITGQIPGATVTIKTPEPGDEPAAAPDLENRPAAGTPEFTPTDFEPGADKANLTTAEQDALRAELEKELYGDTGENPPPSQGEPEPAAAEAGLPLNQPKKRFASLADSGKALDLPRAPKPAGPPRELADSTYTILDAVREHGPRLGGPDLAEAMREMDEGKTARQVVARFAGSGGEYDGLADVLEEIHTAKVSKRRRTYNVLSKAYELSGFGGNRRGIDTVLDSMLDARKQGLGFPGMPESPEALISDAFEAARAKAEGRHLFPTDAEGKAELFWRTATTPESPAGLERVDVGDLKVGQVFRLKGKGLSHEEFEVKGRDGDLVILKDGPTFGTQELPAGTEIYVQRAKGATKSVMAEAGIDAAEARIRRGRARLNAQARVEEEPSGNGDELHEEPPLFGEPESVQQQKERLAREAEQKRKALERQKMLDRQAKPLAGTRSDIGQRDLFGGGDMFAREEPGDPSLWHVTDDELRSAIDDHLDRNDNTPAWHHRLDVLEREAKERGLIDKTSQEEQAAANAEAEQQGQREAELEREKARTDEDIRRRKFDRDNARRELPDLGEEPDPADTGESLALAIRKAAPLLPAETVTRLEFLLKERARAKELLALQPHESDAEGRFPGNGAGVGHLAQISYIDGTIDAALYPTDTTIESLRAERRRELELMKQSPRESSTSGGSPHPATRQGVYALARVRYLEGQIDYLEQAFERAKAAKAPGQLDLFENWLDEAIRKTDPLTGGQVMEGVSGLPVWLTKTLANGALRVLRIAYRASKDIQISINEAVNWLREQRIKGFDDNEANDWLKSEIEKVKAESSPDTSSPAAAAEPEPAEPPKPGQRPVDQVKAERDQADRELRQAIKLKPGERKAEHAQRVGQAAAKFHNLQEELLQHPDYIKEQLLAEHRGDTQGARELEQVPDAYKERLRLELQGEGKLPKPPDGSNPDAGRSIDALTDWLKQNEIDSPKRTLRERLDLAKRLADGWQQTKDSFERARTSLAAAWRTGLESIKHPPIDTGFRNAIKEWIFYDTWTGTQTKQWIDAIKRRVENPLRRMGISIWLDAKGDQGLLKYQRDAVPERWRAVWDKALQLTPDEQNLARRIKADFEQKLSDAKNAGLIEKGRQDYGVPQVWAKAPEPPLELDSAFATADGPQGSPGNWAAKLDPRDPFFAFQRTHPTYFDGIMAGGVPRSLDVADLVGVYNEAFHKSLGSRAAIWSMNNVAAADGLPLVKLSGSARLSHEEDPGTYFIDSHTRRQSDVSADGRPYRPIDHFALRDWKVANKTADGQLLFVRGDMLVHPDHYDFLKNELLKSPLREGPAGRILNPIFKSSSFLKASKLALGTFHLATIAEHALFHLMSPSVRGFDIDLRDGDQALLVKHGLELGLSGPQTAFEEGLASHGGLFEKVPGLGDFSRKFSDWLFRDYIPRLSMKHGLEILERNRARYADKLSDGQIAELTAHQMNAAFGLQNYRLLGRNKILLDLGQLSLLAPQFLTSRAKVVAQAFKPYGMEQRRLLIIQAATMYVGARLLNAWLDEDHDPHWDPKLAFNVVFKGRAYGLRTIVGDMWHMFTDPKSFAAGRLSPLTRIGIETMTQRDLRTGARKEPPFQTEFVPSRVAQNLVVDLAKWLLPVGSEGLLPGAAGREQGPIDTALSSVGIGSHKYTRSTEVSTWARDFNRNGDAHARTYQRERDADAHGESTYRKLDALLDAGKLDQAANEYRALLQDGHADKSIEQRYERGHPFTGSKEREALFQQSLDPKQKLTYQRALDERKQREAVFRQMLDRAKAATN